MTTGRTAFSIKCAMLLSTAMITTHAVSPAYAQTASAKTLNIPSQPLAMTLTQIGRKTGAEIVFSAADVRGKNAAAVRGSLTTRQALENALRGTGFKFRVTQQGAFAIEPAELVGNVATRTAAEISDNEIIVTAQKKEERITDVPIAVSALSAEALDNYKIESGSELLRAIPNVNFSKNNFSMYNFSIRGVGTKATSASSDPAVAISFNNAPLVKNRLFEAEFFDVERIEVLRGPQGTLYGRNATGGVVNIISIKPTDELEGSLKAETGNYESRRLSGMLNVPVTDTLGVRVAGAWTKRDGYDFNTFNQTRVNGRDLWSSRATVAWEPSDNFKADLVWQHFEEDDNRSRTGKNLCTRDPGPDRIGNSPLIVDPFVRGRLSQGCLPGSLYDDAAFGAPNGYSLSYIIAPQNMTIGRVGSTVINALKAIDPYGEVVQSKNLREIATSIDPLFRANNNVFQLNAQLKLSPDIKLISQTTYTTDDYFSFQDYNRFVSAPLFNDSQTPGIRGTRGGILDTVAFPGMTPGGEFFDPQLGWQDRMVSADISQSKSKQWYQEFRLQSEFDGKLNFNIGANYLKYKAQDDYYVFNNLFTLIGQYFYGAAHPTNGLRVPRDCPLGSEAVECIYIDPNPIGSLDNQGHNYFLSQNPVKIESKALFGELYYNATDNLKITVGARYTADDKRSRQIPSQLLLGGGTDTATPGTSTGGRVNSGYPELPPIHQKWKEVTGRFVVDWKPDVSFADDSLVYLSLARGYKGGGSNPPRVDLNPELVQYLPLAQTFKPETLNSLEIGTKTKFAGGRFMLNATGFFYDYKNYQISQISDRIAFNENFDATTWGLELEAVWKPSKNFRFDANLGYLRTKIGKGEKSIDPMNRTQGNEDWVVVRPWVQAPSNCIAPRVHVERILSSKTPGEQQLALSALCPGSNRLGDFNPATTGGVSYDSTSFFGYGFTYDPSAPYNPDTVGLPIASGGSGAPNMGRGFDADLSGNELPNSPRITFNVGGEYRTLIDQDRWELVLRGDYYRQSSSWWRVYNHPTFDKIKGWDNANLSVSLNSLEHGLGFQVYVKNIFNKDSITDAFLNADDTGLATNVFTVDPRIIGFSISKAF